MQRLPRILAAGANGLFILLIVAWLAAVVLIPIAALTGTPVDLGVPVSFTPKSATIVLPGGTSGEITSAVGTLQFKAVFSLPTAALALLGMSLLFLPAAWCLRLVCRVLSDIAFGSAFLSANAGRLRTVGLILIGGAFAWAAYAWVLGTFLARNAQVTGITIVPQFHVSGVALLTAVLVIVLASVWRHGSQLQTEADLTV
jgi:hypothetical protein